MVDGEEPPVDWDIYTRLDCIIKAFRYPEKAIRDTLKLYRVPIRKMNKYEYVPRVLALTALESEERRCPFRTQVPKWALILPEVNAVSSDVKRELKKAIRQHKITVLTIRMPTSKKGVKVVKILSKEALKYYFTPLAALSGVKSLLNLC